MGNFVIAVNMAPWWRSKTFWTVSIVGESVGSLIAYDRFRLKQVRDGLLAEAQAMGEEPATEDPRKVTIVTMAEDARQLQRIRRLWRQYAVDLFTKAGCDYQLIEVNAAVLDRELDRRLPVPDGQVPEAGERPPERIFTPTNWIKPMVHLWMQRLHPGPRPGEGLLFDAAFGADNDGKMQHARALWEERRVEPHSERLLTDGIVSLDASSFQAVQAGIEAVHQQGTVKGTIGGRPRVGYIPCDPSPSWYRSLYLVCGPFMIGEWG